MKKPQQIVLTLPCIFSDAERLEKSTRLTAAVNEQAALIDEKSEVSKTYTDQINALSQEMRMLARKLRFGGEDRPVDCVVEFHTPIIGTKRTVRLDTGEELKQEPMTDDERQENLFEETEAIERMFDLSDPRETQAPGDPENSAGGE